MQLDKDTIQLIQNQLRKASIIWSGRKLALENARIKRFEKFTKKGSKPIYKYYWQCANCKELFRDQAQVEVDHIVEVGPFNNDWNDWIGRLFCGQDNLQVLCTVCHLKKTSGFNASIKYKRGTYDADEGIL